MFKAVAVGTFAGAALATSTALLSVPCGLAGIVDGSGRASNGVMRGWAELLLRLAGIRVRTLGAERIPPGPVVFAANHASALDIPVLFHALPHDFRIIYKRSLGLVPFMGWSLWAGRHVAIDRANPFKARRSLAAAALRIKGGTSVLVFPEGTRASGGETLPFKRGSVLLAIQAGVPVVPVSLVGVKRRIPNGLCSLTPGDVSVRFHEPIPTRDRAPEAAGELAEEVRAIVVNGLLEP